MSPCRQTPSSLSHLLVCYLHVLFINQLKVGKGLIFLGSQPYSQPSRAANLIYHIKDCGPTIYCIQTERDIWNKKLMETKRHLKMVASSLVQI